VAEGHLLAWDQFKLPLDKPAVYAPPAGTVTVDETEKTVAVRGTGFAITFDKASGTLSSFAAAGKELIVAGGRPDLSRAQNDNERRQKQKKSNPAWDVAGANAVVSSVDVEQSGGSAKITIRKFLPDVRAGFSAVYTVFGTGEVVVEAAFNFENTPDDMGPPLRAGMEWKIPAAFENMEWFGRGGETYLDRAFEPVGLYAGTVDGQWTDYSRPQENGNKTDVRWLALTDGKGNGLLVCAEGVPIGIGARHYSAQTMRESDYSFQMERSEDIFLNIDATQSGVGGINSWSAPPLEKHRLNAKTYRYAYRLRPLSGDIEKKLSSRTAFQPTNIEKLAVPDASVLPEIKVP